MGHAHCGSPAARCSVPACVLLPRALPCPCCCSQHSAGSDPVLSYIAAQLAATGSQAARSGASSRPELGTAPTSASAASSSLPLEMQRWEVRWEDIQLERQVGRGSFGWVYAGFWSGTEVAVKVLINAGEWAGLGWAGLGGGGGGGGGVGGGGGGGGWAGLTRWRVLCSIK